jgi:serine/threonine-protein kinase
MFETLGHYKILDRIGAGGMGEVLRARDTRLGRTVAVRVIAEAIAGEPSRREAFLRDARTASVLSHPNIATLYEIGEDQGALFLVFEFVPGETLKRAIAGRPMNPRRAVDLAVQIADALADAHAVSIVHGDLRPDHVLVTPKGNAKILDVGLAQWAQPGAEREQIAAPYRSPEQSLGERFDHRTDIFSLGVMLFEMLTGRVPFAGTPPSAMALKIAQAAVPAPSTVNRQVPVELDPIVDKALAKSLDRRYEAAATLAAELRSVGAILDVRNDEAEMAAAFAVAPPRRSYGGWIAAIVLLGAIGAGAWLERDAIAGLWRHTLGSPPSPVIAVIPFEVGGGDAASVVFADGVADDLMARLGQTPGLKVVGRSALRSVRGRPARDVARELGAAVALTGLFRRDADSVNLSLTLVDPRDGSVVWNTQYGHDIKSIFALYAQIAADVAQALRIAPHPTPSSARAASRQVDPRGYELYLLALDAAAHRHAADAIALYEQAVAMDVGLGEAFAGLAEARQLDVVFNGQPDDEAHRQRVKDAAKRAYEVDADLTQANVAMALDADTASQSLGYLRHAVDLDPSNARAFEEMGHQLEDIDPERAIELYRKSLALDSSLDASRISMATVLFALDRPDAAAVELTALRPGSPFAVWGDALRLRVEVEHQHFEHPLAVMRESSVRAMMPPLWLQYVQTQRMAGFAPEALREAAVLAARFPGLCQPRALVAGLQHERHDEAGAKLMVEPLLRAAHDESASPSALRCGVMAAAAMGNADETAALLDRIAGREEWLHYWTLTVGGDSSAEDLRGRWYPWSLVSEKPPVVTARQKMASAYERQREVARTALAGL